MTDLDNNSIRATGRALLTNKLGIPLSVDEKTKSIATICVPGKSINEGKHFYITDARRMDENDELEILLTTPNTDVETHVFIQTMSTSELDIEFFKDSDRVGSGATLTPVNNNLGSAATSGLTVHGAITGGTTDGTTIAHFIIGKAGTNPVKGGAGGSGGSSEKIILDRNSKYLLRYTSLDDGNIINNLASWEEITPIP